ncbi:1,6-anhydro-N-acetylmuramyl-L-alanine amidase AmpD [Enterobacter bugandensis]|uniref:1,6-anhydro-N-acetylmuramyl-L-alanine amidase AmpD n=1 Tax=Enterobacter bugandensis TaxID=881260 RepID=UPI00254E6AC6|nr:1,6-anhydro-N-acetylmuramyl-L-alanine amidase AmpD [Enterobacter bugandensis]MEC5650362.1 1,6-anhydro-N-acetylmuramyl-L-alanine amidase AmpD [Enterobacter bugandensis]
MLLENGWLVDARHVPSPHHDCRPEDEKPTLLVVHNISLPPGEFGGPWIDALFTGTIDPTAHPFFAEIAHLRVSAHCLIRRDGEVVQYVPFDKRAWQTWLARYLTPHERLLSGIDAILHVLDWLPVRLVGVVYALIGHGEKALPAWFASLGDRHTSQYQVLTRLAQFSLAREPHTDKIETPKAAVSMAKKTSFVVVVIVALLTIYGTLV